MRPEDNPADEAFERDLMLSEIATLARQLAEAKNEEEKWRTAARVLCAAHVGIPQPTCPVCAIATATAQRDAMRGALENALRDVRNMFPDDDEAHVDHCVCTRCRIRKTLVSR